MAVTFGNSTLQYSQPGGIKHLNLQSLHLGEAEQVESMKTKSTITTKEYVWNLALQTVGSFNHPDLCVSELGIYHLL